MSDIQGLYSVRAGAAVTPSDSASFQPCRALYVGGAGNVVVVFENDTTLTLTAVPAGSFLPLRIKRVNSTSTTASSMAVFY
jgi:hypothetical protein